VAVIDEVVGGSERMRPDQAPGDEVVGVEGGFGIIEEAGQGGAGEPDVPGHVSPPIEFGVGPAAVREPVGDDPRAGLSQDGQLGRL
jgi:hypothetical protein